MSQTIIDLTKKNEKYLLEIAKIEHKDLTDILSEAIEDYISRYKETLELTNNMEYYSQIQKGKEEVAKGIKEKSLDELED